ncbi:MAG: sigma-70 family RNA polymerase sigma factor [Nocardioides sp.]|nr:sigma-70 family RNA polymerase sigma factor [Nocardioides sp.]
MRSGLDASYEEFAGAATQRLLGLAFALTGDPHDAWDLTQATLARVGERWLRSGAAPLADPAAYARTVMVRLNIDRIRRLRRELLPGSTPDSLVVEVTGEVDAWLVEALATLSPRQRTAVALRFVEDLDVAGVAERMGCSVGTAKSHLSRGTDRLKQYATAAGITTAGQETP